MTNKYLSNVKKLKILKEYADAKVKGLKHFEIRKNDREYKVGDLIRYIVIDEYGKEINHILNYTLWQIIYITNYQQKKGYIVFSDINTQMPF